MLFNSLSITMNFYFFIFLFILFIFLFIKLMQSKIIKLTIFVGINTLVYYWFLL